MILKNYLALFFLLLTSVSIGQVATCESPKDELLDANTIGKCAIEDFKKSNNKEFVKIATRNRFVRKKKNSYLNNFKKKINTNTIAKNNDKLEAKETLGTNTGLRTISIAKKEEKIEKYEVEQNFIRFDQVNHIPVFITCANVSMAVKEECIKETFINNILENFTYPFDAASEGIEGRVWVRFIIDKEGYVKEITTKGPENGVLLEKEAKRLVNLLPKFMPGKHNGDYVNVEYFMPIDFELDE